MALSMALLLSVKFHKSDQSFIIYKHQEFRASGLCAVHCGISETEKWAPTLEEQPY